jgi:hypothetical protein
VRLQLQLLLLLQVIQQHQQPNSSIARLVWSLSCQLAQGLQLLLVLQSCCSPITPCEGQCQHLWIMLQQLLLQMRQPDCRILPAFSSRGALSAEPLSRSFPHQLLLLPPSAAHKRLRSGGKVLQRQQQHPLFQKQHQYQRHLLQLPLLVLPAVHSLRTRQRQQGTLLLLLLLLVVGGLLS